MADSRPRAFHRSEIPFVFFNTDRAANQTGGTDEARAGRKGIGRLGGICTDRKP